MRKTAYKAGKIIVKEGEIGSDAYIIVDGEVELTRSCSDGSEIVLGTLSDNMMFGEVSMVDPLLRRTATVKALTDVVVAIVPQDSFQEKLQNTPVAVKSITKLLAKRLADTNDMLVELHNKIQILVAQQVGEVIKKNKFLNIQLKQKDEQIEQLQAEIETLKVSGPPKSPHSQTERQKVDKDRSMKISLKDMGGLPAKPKNKNT